MSKKISILGCGWLGLPLAEKLLMAGASVKGSTTRTDKLALLQAMGIEPFLIHLSPTTPADSIGSFFDADLLIIDIPPGIRKNGEEFHIRQMKQVAELCRHVPNVIFISSTSVYPDLNREVTEEDVTSPEEADSKTLAMAEQLVRSGREERVTVLRCAGLTGYERLLVRHFAGKKGLDSGNQPVNLVHRDDVIEIILKVIMENRWGKIYNVCSPLHPLKKDFYSALAQQFHMEAPEFSDMVSPFKIISTRKLMEELNYTYIFSDPYQYTYTWK